MPGLVSVQRVWDGGGRTGETHEVYEFGNHPFKLNVSELYLVSGGRSKKIDKGGTSVPR